MFRKNRGHFALDILLLGRVVRALSQQGFDL
jgi:hypothetical protein